MNIKRILLLLSLLFGLTIQSAQAQTLSNVVTVSFGSLVVGGSGTVTIPSTSDTRSATGGVVLIGGTSAVRGTFDVTYTPGAQVFISFPGTINMTGPSTPIFNPEIEGGTVQTIPVSGVLTIRFGGTLTFTGSSPGGSLTADIPVTVVP
jgi:hypothetical protein